MKDELLKYWHIQEYLLQSYRRLFATSQSIIFAIASIMAINKQPTILSLMVYTILLILGLFLFYYWKKIAHATGFGVSYFQMQLLKLENGESIDERIMTNFKKWQALDDQAKLDQLQGFNLSRSSARTVLEDYLAWVFLVLWVTLTVVVFYTIVMRYVLAL